MSRSDPGIERLSDKRSDTPDAVDRFHERMDAVRGGRDRLHSLLEAVLFVGRELDLAQVVRNTVGAATVLVDAGYGTLGLIGGDELPSEFTAVAVGDGQGADWGTLPRGHGLLGGLDRRSGPLRLELSEHRLPHRFPPSHPPRSFLGTPIHVRGKVFGNLCLSGKRGAPEFDADDEAVLSALAAAAGVAVEKACVYEESRRRGRWLAAGTEVTNRLLSGCPRAEVLALILEHARANIPSDVGMLAVPVEGTGKLRIALATGMDAERHQGTLLPRADSRLGGAFAGLGPWESQEVEHGPRTAGAAACWAGLGPSLAVPLGSGSAARGVLLLARERGGARYGEDESGPLARFAQQAALAMELAERRRDTEHLAIREDRDHIARDLHDLVIQRLFATGMTLRSVQRFVDRLPAAEKLQRAVSDLDITIEIIRSTIFGIHAHETGAAFREVLRHRVMRIAEASTTPLGFPPTVRIEGVVATRVPGTVADHVTAVLTEALSNVARHAQANAVDVHLYVASDRLTLTVTDDGTGIPADAARSGLRNIEERARTAGGTAEVHGPARGGTQLLWTVPLTAATAEE